MPDRASDRPGLGRTVEVFFDPAYCAADLEFDTTRKAARIADDLDIRPIPTVKVRSPEPATVVDLERIHDPNYVDAVLTGEPFHLAESAGLRWDPGLVTGVLASIGGCIAAAAAAWEHGIAGSLSSGLHHARRSSGAGFCAVNGVALAALTFVDLGASRVLVVDLDAHCGGGTASILGGNPRISSIDISTDPYDRYDPPPGWTLDLVHDPADYLPTIESRLALTQPGTVDAMIYNAGMDPHEDCGTGGLAGLTDEILVERERLVFDVAARHGIPTAFVLAGGYSSGAMGAEHLTALHRLTIQAAADTDATSDRVAR